jgi:site-specific recombinase XerD
METIDRYRRHLKRRNFSGHTVKNYLHRLALFMAWLPLPLTEVTRREIGRYIDHLLAKQLSPKTITCYLQTIRLFFDYLIAEEQMTVINPITKVSIRLPRPLPRHLKDDQVHKFLGIITDARDRAIFMLMLRCGLRVEEVARLAMDAVELARNRLFVVQGKGGKDRVVYLSKDARSALEVYLKERASKVRRVFLVQKGPLTGTPLSVRGIQ